MTISKLFKKREQTPDIEAILYSEKYYNPAYKFPRLDGETDWEYRDRLRSYQWL